MLPALAISPVRADPLSSSTGAASTAAGAGAAGQSADVAGADFSSVLSKVASDASDTVQSAEATAIQGINGDASTKSVVEAVMAAERTLQTAVSIRDKAVSAYQQVSRMAI